MRGDAKIGVELTREAWGRRPSGALLPRRPGRGRRGRRDNHCRGSVVGRQCSEDCKDEQRGWPQHAAAAAVPAAGRIGGASPHVGGSVNSRRFAGLCGVFD